MLIGASLLVTVLWSLHRKVTGRMERVQCIRNTNLEGQEVDGRVTLTISTKREARVPSNLLFTAEREMAAPRSLRTFQTKITPAISVCIGI